jgi:hypothetical protein
MVVKPTKVIAKTDYITVEGFTKLLAEKIGLSLNDTAKDYISALAEKSIVKDGEFKNVTSNITRTDAAVLINRADEFLHGDKINKTLLDFVQKKRISDIKKVPEGKRDAVAKCFAKGIIKGYSNGLYIQNRKFNGSKKIKKSDAAAYINLIVNTKNRAKLSPDGMLIRTTKLPKNADKYPYILTCYPNSFYEKKFEFMLPKNWTKGLEKDDYGYPIQMRKSWKFINNYDQWAFSKEMNKYLYDWTAMADKYLHYVFNVNYKTVDSKWVKGLAALYGECGTDMTKIINKYYIQQMKANHVVVESKIIAVEPSSLYYDQDYCIRAYVKYRIKAKNIKTKQYQLIYSQYPALDNLKNGKWRTGIFDIRFGTNNGSSGDGSDFNINEMTHFVDAYNVKVK